MNERSDAGCIQKGYILDRLRAGDSLGRIAIILMMMSEADLAEAQKEIDEFVRARSGCAESCFGSGDCGLPRSRASSTIA